MGQETSTRMCKVRKSRATVDPTYEDFEPLIDWVQEEERDTIFVNLPGFKKEQLKIEVNELRKMKISGERPMQGNNWTRFCHEFTVPDYCNLSKILCIDFANGILSVSLPKMTTQTSGQDQRPQTKVSVENCVPPTAAVVQLPQTRELVEYRAPIEPCTSRAPRAPCEPCAPRAPRAPCAPIEPCAPRAPRAPCAPPTVMEVQHPRTKECVCNVGTQTRNAAKDVHQPTEESESIRKVATQTQNAAEDQHRPTKEFITKVESKIFVQDQCRQTKESITKIETQTAIQDQHRPTEESISKVDVQISVQDQRRPTEESKSKVDIQIAVQDQCPPTEESKSKVTLQDQHPPTKESIVEKAAEPPIYKQDQPVLKVGSPIEKQDQPMLKDEIPVNRQDQPMLKAEPLMDSQDQPMLKDGPLIDRQDQPMPFKESYKYSKESCEYSKGSSLIGLSRPRELNVNVVVATMVGLAVGIGVTYCAKRR